MIECSVGVCVNVCCWLLCFVLCWHICVAVLLMCGGCEWCVIECVLKYVFLLMSVCMCACVVDVC